MQAITNFNQNLEYARSLVGIASAVDSLTTTALDVADIHRAALVMGVSALDHYIHERIRELLVAKYQAGTLTEEALNKVTIPLAAIAEAQKSPGDYDWLDAAIKSSHGYKTFQRSRAISEIYKLVTSIKVWPFVGSALHRSSIDIQRDLDLIIDRRNKIAHEADLNPLTLTKWPMSPSDAEGSLAFINDIVRALDILP